jgi:radical SAM superfamily enzyme YgiQ (UPF0313 family)
MRASFVTTPISGIIGLEMITFVEPLGLECVAGALEADGHQCQIVDLRIDGLEPGLAKVRRFAPELIGIQCMFTTQRFRVVRLAERMRREFPNAFLMIGGHDASRQPEWFLRSGADAVALGDGEEVMPELVRVLEEGRDPSKVPGLVLNRAGQAFATGPAPRRKHIDELALPARHLIKEYADQYYINFRRPLALLETARGCPFKCNFCSVWKFHESTFREKSAERVVEELAQIEQPNVFITDDIFWLDVKRSRELAAAIKASGIRKHFNVQTRSDIVCKFPFLVEMWKECGKITVFLGLESIDDEGLDLVNKSNTAANNDRAIEILQDLDVGYTPNFIVDPSWDREHFDRLKRWIDRTGAYNSGFSILTPLPGTDLWETSKYEVTTEDWELYDIAHTVLPTRLPLAEFYREYCGLWQHALDTRYGIEGRLRVNLGILAALATRRVTVGAMRRGMRMGKALSDASRFLEGHEDSEARLEKYADLVDGLPQRPKLGVAS